MRELAVRVLRWVPLVVSLGLVGGQAATSRARPLWDMEYAEWVDGQRYSMTTWRYWEDVKFAMAATWTGATVCNAVVVLTPSVRTGGTP